MVDQYFVFERNFNINTYNINNNTYENNYSVDNLYFVISFYLIIIGGLTGNILLILTIIDTKELHNSIYYLIANLAVIDILLCILFDTFYAISFHYGPDYFYEIIKVCQFTGIIETILLYAALANILFISLNRYIQICHFKQYGKMFTKYKTIIYIALIWVYGFLVAVVSATTVGYVFDEKFQYCPKNRITHRSILMIITGLFGIVPGNVFFLVYMKIFYYVYKSSKKISANIGSNIPGMHLRKSYIVAKGLLFASMPHTILLFPYALIIFFDIHDTLPAWIYKLALVMANSTSTVTPYIQLASNPSIKMGFRGLILRMKKIKSIFQ